MPSRRNGDRRSLRQVAVLARSHPGILWGLLGGTLGKVATFTGGILLAAVISTLEYGEFAAVHLTTYSVAGVFSSGIAIAVNTLGAQQARRRTMAVVALVGTTLCAGLAVPLFPPLLGWLTGPDAETIAASHLLGLVPAAVCFGSASLSALAGRGQVREAARIEVVRGVLGAVGVVVVGVTLGPVAAVYAIGVVDAVVGVAGFLRAEAAKQPQPAAWKTSMRLSTAGVAGAALAQSGLWIAQATLTREYGLEALAAYSLALRFANLVLLPPNFIARNALGDLSRAPRREDWSRVLRANGTASLLLSFLTLATVLLLSVTLFRPLVDRYDAMLSLVALGIVTIIRVTANFLGTACVSRGLRGSWLASDLVGAILMIALSASLDGGTVSLPVFISIAFGAPAILIVLYRALALRRSVDASEGF